MSHAPRSFALPFALTLLLAGAVTAAGATPLNDAFGGANFVDTPIAGTTVALRPELAGTVIADVLTPFAVGDLTGVIQNRVVREAGTGTLDFYWRIEPDATTTGDAVKALRLGNFGYASLTDADWSADGLGTAAPDIARLFNPAAYPSGDINFLFAADGGSFTSSRFFFLHTDATHYAQTAFYDLVDIHDTLSGTYAAFAPSAVPEPAPASALALGLLALGWLRGRRAASRV